MLTTEVLICRVWGVGSGLGGRAMLCYVKRVPRPAGVLVWAAGAVALHAVVPFELSRMDDRAGRPASRPPSVRGAGW